MLIYIVKLHNNTLQMSPRPVITVNQNNSINHNDIVPVLHVLTGSQINIDIKRNSENSDDLLYYNMYRSSSA